MAKTPGEDPLVTREKPSAMPTPTRSWRHTIGFKPACAHASIKMLVGKQKRYWMRSCLSRLAIRSIVRMRLRRVAQTR